MYIIHENLILIIQILLLYTLDLLLAELAAAEPDFNCDVST